MEHTYLLIRNLDTTSKQSVARLICRSILLMLIVLSLSAGKHVQAQETIGVYISPPEEMEFEPSHLPGSTPTAEGFDGFTAPNNSWAPPPGGWTGSPLGTYFQLPTANGNNRLEPPNQFGAGTGNYIVIFDDVDNSHVRLEFDEPQGYFGFAWPAGDDGNSLVVYRDGNPVFTISTGDIVDVLPNDPGETVTALDGSVYNNPDYYCQPGTTDNCGEPYAFLHFIASEGLLFDAIEFHHVSSGGGFEIDNHTILAEPPDPPTSNPWVVVYEIVSPTAVDDESLNNTPQTTVTLDVLNNDSPGQDADGNPVAVDPSTVIITGELPDGSTLAPDGKTLTVPGEGEWTVDETTGEITFTPEGGFSGNPTPIQYRVSDVDGTASNIATVTVTYLIETEITLDGGPCWRMLSSPVDGLTYADMLENIWTQGVPGAEYEGGDSNVFLWDNTATGNTGGWIPPSSLNDPIPAGTGFLVSVYADDNYDGIDDPFPKTLSVSGPAHTGDITPAMNTTDGGWTLVGNPYSQPVDFTALTTGTTELTDIGYVYDRNYTGPDPGDTNGNTGGWRSTDGTFGEVTDGAFAPGQGFFVQNTDPAASPSITFTEADQTTGGEFYGKEKELRDYVRLEVQGESLYNSLWIRFSGDGSVEPAYGDALELQPLAEQYAIFGAMKTDGTLVDIGHFPLPDEALEIPVHAEATQNGTYTITATDLDIPAATELYLHDLDTGETVAITESFEYTFTISQAAKSTPDQGITSCSSEPAKAKTTGGARFMITTSPNEAGGELPQQAGLDQNYPNPFNPSTVIHYQLPVSSEVHLEVFDMLGRRVATLVEGTMQAGRHSVTFDAAHLTSGVYLYRLTANGPQGGQQIFTKKLTLIK